MYAIRSYYEIIFGSKKQINALWETSILNVLFAKSLFLLTVQKTRRLICLYVRLAKEQKKSERLCKNYWKEWQMVLCADSYNFV